MSRLLEEAATTLAPDSSSANSELTTRAPDNEDGDPNTDELKTKGVV